MLVVIANTATPYRIHVQRRIHHEIPEYQLFTVLTHDRGSAPWENQIPPELQIIQFGRGESSQNQGGWRWALHEWQKAGRIIQWLSEHKPTAVLLVGYNDLGRLRLVRWLYRHRVSLFLFGDSNIKSDRARGWRRIIKRIWLRYVLRRCTAVMPCGSLGKAYYLHYGASPSRIRYFPYEPDYSLIESLEAGVIEQVAREYHLAPERRRIVFSGRLVQVKRADLLIKAFVEIAAARPDWDLVLAGDGPLRAELEGLVPPHLKQRVKFTGFVKSQRTLAALYRASDILVLPSDLEPWALVVNEAACAGLALICSDVVGAAAELVRQGVNGFTFPPGDVISLRERLLEATEAGKIDSLKSATRAVLAEWRATADPVTQLRLQLNLPPAAPGR